MTEASNKLEQRYRQILGALPCGYVFGEVAKKSNGDSATYAVNDVNHAFTEMTGLTRRKVVGGRIDGLFSVTSSDEDSRVFVKVALTGEPVQMEFYSPYFRSHFRLFCFSPESGSFIALLSDLSQEKAFQNRLEFLKNFANSTSDEFCIVDPLGRLVLGNRAVASKLGVLQDEIPGQHISRLNPIAEEDWWCTLWLSLEKKGSLQFETDHRSQDGILYPVEVSVDLMDSDGRKYAALVAKNISDKRTLSTALKEDRRFAEIAASMAGYLIWMVDSARVFRPLIGSESGFLSGPVDDVFFSMIHHEDRDRIVRGFWSLQEGSGEFRMKTGRGMAFYRARWSRMENNCVVGICYPVSGAGLAGQGSDSPVMDACCLMAQSFSCKLSKLREAMETGKSDTAVRMVRTLASDYSSLTVRSVFSERVGFDSFLETNRGLLKHLLDSSVELELDTSQRVCGLVDPSFLENVLVRLFLLAGRTGLVRKVKLSTAEPSESASIVVQFSGNEGLQSAMEKQFIPVGESIPGLASVYAMIRSAGGRVKYETGNDTVTLTASFPRAAMSHDSAAIVVTLPDSVDSARCYAALKEAGLSATIENSRAAITDRFRDGGPGVLVLSAYMPDFSVEEIVAGLSGITVIQIGSLPADGVDIHLQEGFSTSELVERVRNAVSKAQKHQEEDLEADTPYAGSHPTPLSV